MSQLLPWVQVTSAIALLVFTTSLLGQEPVQQASTTDRLRATIVHLSQTIGERNLTKAVKSLRKHCKVDVQSASLPSELQGVGWSDHWSFWQEG